MHPAEGLLASVKTLLATLLGIVQTRIEIATTELEEERERLKELLILTVTSLVFLALGLVMFSFLVVAAFWDSYRLHAVGGLAAVYLLLGLGIAAVIRRRQKQRPRLFAATLAELHKDRQQLGTQP